VDARNKSGHDGENRAPRRRQKIWTPAFAGVTDRRGTSGTPCATRPNRKTRDMRTMLALIAGQRVDHRAVFEEFARGLANVLMRRRPGTARIRAVKS